MRKDIEKAIEAETKYINENGKNIYDYLRPHGYDNLDEYFKDKAKYLLLKNNFKLYLYEPTTGIDLRVWEAMKNKESCIWVPQLEKVLACVGTADVLNEELCNKLNVGILHMPHQGGTIITGPDDLTIGIHFPKNSSSDYTFFFNKMKDYLKQFNILPEGNDFLYNNKKVIGCSHNETVEGMNSFFFSATFSDHTELIKQLCNKKSNKIPGVIPNNILTKQKLLKEVLSWVNMHI